MSSATVHWAFAWATSVHDFLHTVLAGLPRNAVIPLNLLENGNFLRTGTSKDGNLRPKADSPFLELF